MGGSIYAGLTRETLAEVDKFLASEAAKAGLSTGTGLVAINLEQTAKLLVPIFSPLRSEIPRVTPKGNVAGLQPQWRQITAFNSGSTKLYTPEGKRGAAITYTTATKSAPYVTLGLENNATFEAESAAIGFDDIDELATLGLLNESFKQEEKTIIGSNASIALGQTGTPVLTLEASGGSLTSGNTYKVACVALTYDGLDITNATGSVPQLVTNAQAGPVSGNTTFNGGSAIISAISAGTPTTGANQSIVATTTAIAGAMGYAWFLDNNTGSAATTYFIGTTTINSINITQNPDNTKQTFGSLTSGTDYSRNFAGINAATTGSYDGIISQTVQSGLVIQQPTGTIGVGGAGTGLTAAATGQGVGIVEIDNVLLTQWNNFNSWIEEILVNAQELNNITNKILSAGSAPLIRFNYSREEIESGKLVGGTVVGTYLNKYVMGGPALIPIKLHPYVPAGTILLRPKTVPYQIQNVGTILRVNTRRDYYQLAWPLTTRQREWGIYWESVLQNYAPFMFAMITNIANK